MTKNLVIVADTGSILSLISINCLALLDSLFLVCFIPNAVFEELLSIDNNRYGRIIKKYFSGKVKSIQQMNSL